MLLFNHDRRKAAMPAVKKIKEKDAGARRRLLDATAQIMRDEGYAAATSRRVAALAGVKPALVYYYFDTMDELFLALLRAGADVSLNEMRQALTDDDPLRALWLINCDARRTALNTEFMALANHRKVIGAELKVYAERVRDIETAAVTVALRAHGVDLEEYPPVVISMLIAQMARSMCNEVAIGVTDGHDAMRAFLERFLVQYGAKAPSS
jgi:TetR/AcrR family transcriptional regulator, regulator of autoinduction and epiphytic fitness